MKKQVFLLLLTVTLLTSLQRCFRTWKTASPSTLRTSLPVYEVWKLYDVVFPPICGSSCAVLKRKAHLFGHSKVKQTLVIIPARSDLAVSGSGQICGSSLGTDPAGCGNSGSIAPLLRISNKLAFPLLLCHLYMLRQLLQQPPARSKQILNSRILDTKRISHQEINLDPTVFLVLFTQAQIIYHMQIILKFTA